MLPDKFFTWPYIGDSLEEAVADMRPLLEKSGGLAPWERPECMAGTLSGFIAFLCREYNVSPFWVLTSLQREQSLLGSGTTTTKAIQAACGVVGQDVGRVDLPGYYGLYTQVARCVDVTAWLLGVESSLKWPENVRTRKAAPRYQVGKVISNVDMGNGVKKDYIPVSRGDWVQLQYTPHISVLRTNEKIAREITPAKLLL